MCPFTISVPNPRYKSLKHSELYRYSMRVFGMPEPPDMYIPVPCGHCKYCLRKKRTEWRLRLLNEHEQHTKTIFVTLSISPKYYKDFVKNPSPFIRKFLDNLRKKRRLHPNVMFKHWFISEGGACDVDEHRFHFHGFLFGVVKRDITYRKIRQCWPYGHTWLTQSCPKLCNYTTKYVTKESTVQQRIYTSAGIGVAAERYLDFDSDIWRYVGYFTLSNRPHKYFVPTYYKGRKRMPPDITDEVLYTRMVRGVLVPPLQHKGVVYDTLYDFVTSTRADRCECIADSEQFTDWILNKYLYSRFFRELQ